MDFRHLFLSFEGRTRRLHFWLGGIILWVVEWVVSSFTLGANLSNAALRGNPAAIWSAFNGVGLFGALILIALIWPSLAIQVKRWHDRDKTGWMVLINLIPIDGLLLDPDRVRLPGRHARPQPLRPFAQGHRRHGLIVAA